MTVRRLAALLGLLALALPAQSALAQQPAVPARDAQPHNDYGTMSEEVARQRLRLAGFTQITLTKTATGYQALATKAGQQHTLQVDAARGHITENAERVHLPEMVHPEMVHPAATPK